MHGTGRKCLCGITRTGISGSGTWPAACDLPYQSGGKASEQFYRREREWNIVDSMATDAQGRLYMRMRMQEDGSYVRIYSAEGELIGRADDDSYAVQGAGALGQARTAKSMRLHRQWAIRQQEIWL